MSQILVVFCRFQPVRRTEHGQLGCPRRELPCYLTVTPFQPLVLPLLQLTFPVSGQAALSQFNCRIRCVGDSVREGRRSVQVGFETPCTGREASFSKWSDSAPIPSDGWYSPMFPPSRPRFSKSFRLRAEACGFRSRVFASVVLKAVFRVREKRNLPRLLGCVVFPHVKSRLHFYSALGFAE